MARFRAGRIPSCCTTCERPWVLSGAEVVLRSQLRLMLEGRTRTLSGPSPDLSPARTLAPVRILGMLAAVPGQVCARQLPLDDLASDLGELAVAVTRVGPYQQECFVHRHGEVLGQHSLRLLDDHPAIQRCLQLLD